ncbi:hypothetical protein F5Y03DRAFT_377944 [Xylaria venustula]|nr:hypothetical protein F5Y03DRAFT_377944 [Xylaria venustula]
MSTSTGFSYQLLNTFLIVEIVLIVLVAAVVAARLGTNYKHNRKLYVDDYFCIPAVILFTALSVIYYLTQRVVHDTASNLYHISQISTSSFYVGSFGVWFAKAPLLFLYIRLFGVKKWVQVLSYATLASTSIVYFTTSTYAAAECGPIGHTLDAVYFAKCTIITDNINIVNGVFSVVEDVIIFCIPLPIVSSLNLKPRKKLGIAFVFAWGLVAIAASALALHLKYSTIGDRSGYFVSELTTLIDCAIAIIVSCVPSIHALWVHHIINLSLYSKIRSAFSAISLARSVKSKDSRGSPTCSDHELSQHFDSMPSDQYLELGVVQQHYKLDHGHSQDSQREKV